MNKITDTEGRSVVTRAGFLCFVLCFVFFLCFRVSGIILCPSPGRHSLFARHEQVRNRREWTMPKITLDDLVK